MRRLRPAPSRFFGTLAAAFLLALAACEDPSGVGLTVLEPGESDPRARTIPAGGVAPGLLPDQTGAFVSSAGFQDFNVLAGAADDPVFGAVTAYGYLDVLPPQALPEGFRSRPIERARLRLVRSYVYGDTTGVTTLEVRQVAEEWAAAGATADTTFPVMDDVIARFDVAPGDSLVEVALAESWVAALDTTLRSADVSNLFHGFRLSSADGAAVYGFNGRSSLELITAEDTVQFGASELFSHIAGEGGAGWPEGLEPIRDGSGTGLRFDLALDTLGTPALSTASIRVNADTAAAQAGLPPGFVRPLARELALFGTVEGEDPLLLGLAELDPATQTYSFRSPTVTSILQDLILGRAPVDGFAVGAAPSQAGLGVMAVVTPPAEAAPRAVLVLFPTQD